MVLPAEPSVAGSVNEMVTGLLAWPLTSNRPAFVRSVAAIVLFTPGNTFPKLNCCAPTTLIGVWTLAVADAGIVRLGLEGRARQGQCGYNQGQLRDAAHFMLPCFVSSY